MHVLRPCCFPSLHFQTLSTSASLSLSISSQTAVPTLLNCTTTAGPHTRSSEVYGVSLPPSASFRTVSNLCLDNSTQYSVTLTNTGGENVLVDSVSSPISAFQNSSCTYKLFARFSSILSRVY